MKANLKPLLDVLGRPGVRFTVPVFQRVYSWTANECETLMDDMLAAAATGSPHFVGTLICSPDREWIDGVSEVQVIDGQQRLTTFTLMLLAYVEKMRSRGGEDAALASETASRYLLCGGTDAEAGADIGADADAGAGEAVPDAGCAGAKVHSKLLLSSIDAAMLDHLLGLKGAPDDVAQRLLDNLEVFRSRMSTSKDDLDAVWRGFGLLQVIAIDLSEDDSPQDVFESLNSKGKRLAVEDLVRNAILNGSGGKEAALDLYERVWLPMEAKVEAVASLSMEEVLCSWIASHHNVFIDSRAEVYPLFKSDLKGRYGGSCKRMLSDLSYYVDRMVSNEDWRRSQLFELDRWLQGKPKNFISERRMFGD